MTDLSKIETVIMGCFIALLSALDRGATDRAIETLFAFVEDSRTPAYERGFYTDLADTLELLSTAPPALLFEELATLH